MLEMVGIVENTPAQLSTATREGKVLYVPRCDVRWVGQWDRKAPKTQHSDVDLVPEQTNKQNHCKRSRVLVTPGCKHEVTTIECPDGSFTRERKRCYFNNMRALYDAAVARGVDIGSVRADSNMIKILETVRMCL
jgi:hypothetical protein